VTCSWCEERFERFVDGACTDAERVRLLAHIDTCNACSGLLEELRVVDGLLLEPRAIELPADFTHATMADVHALPLPRTSRRPLLAWLASFIAGAWCLIGAASLIAPKTVLGTLETALHVARELGGMLGAVGRMLAHLASRGDLASWSTVAGGIVLADVLALALLIAVVRFARPRLTSRLRW
jgi:anti-sigma factor RsiW